MVNKVTANEAAAMVTLKAYQKRIEGLEAALRRAADQLHEAGYLDAALVATVALERHAVHTSPESQVKP